MSSAIFDNSAITPVEKVYFESNSGNRVELLVKRDDLIHPQISGNKWRKLKHNLTSAIATKSKGIASFGGAFSNHIAALSALGNIAGINTLGIIRGDGLDVNNPTLRLAKENGMAFHFVTREQYRQRNNPDFLAELNFRFPNYFWVPEGGSNQQAQKGVWELGDEITSWCLQTNTTLSHIACPIGSGGTISGLLKSQNKPAIGVAVVKDNRLLSHLEECYGENLNVHRSALFGGYGKVTSELEAFCLDFMSQTNIPIEPIYTGKMFYALCYQREEIGLKPQDLVLAVHTGGLQGLNGLFYRHQIDEDAWKATMSNLAL